MTKLKNKIRNIPPLPNKIKKKTSPIKIILTIPFIISMFIGLYFTLKQIYPYINAVKINKIIGKKISTTECNTLEYIIINIDKTYSMKITDENCNINELNGNIIIKNNIIYFQYEETINNKIIKKEKQGIIDKNYNILINNNTFMSEKNE